MKISELDFLHLLPAFMRDDEAVIALSGAIDKLFGDLHVDTLSTWDRIDELTDAECDDLAWEFDIDWYETSMSIEEKRKTIKLAQQIKRKRGTKWSVESILSLYLGEGGVIEWFEKEPPGPPFTFEVYTSNANTTEEMFAQFEQAVAIAKNTRSHMVGLAHRYLIKDIYTGRNWYLYVDGGKLKAELSNATVEAGNMLFIDTETGEYHRLVFVDGKLKLTVPTGDIIYNQPGTKQEEYPFKDMASNTTHTVYVKNGDLMIE